MTLASAIPFGRAMGSGMRDFALGNAAHGTGGSSSTVPRHSRERALLCPCVGCFSVGMACNESLGVGFDEWSPLSPEPDAHSTC